MAWYLLFVASLPDVSKQDAPLEIVFQDPRDQKNLFVQAPPSENTLDKKPDKPARLKSDRTQRVELESFKKPILKDAIRASMESARGNGKKKSNNANKKNKNKRRKQVADQGDYFLKKGQVPLELPGFGSASSSPPIPAFVQQQMPDGVRLGSITALNTDQHRFYSFNQRLLTRFIPLWGRRVRAAVHKWLAKNGRPSISKNWVTNVEVIMDDKGQVIDVKPFRLSALWDVDEAAIQSFKDIDQVPNPPLEMIDENGYIHMQFQTQVIYVPQPGMRFQGGN